MQWRIAVSVAALWGMGAWAPPSTAGTIDMASLWPNEDGRSWTHDQHTEEFFPPRSVDRRVRIYFDGTAVAPNGIDVQVLAGEVLIGTPPMNASGGYASDPLLRAIHAARPDLRAAIENRDALRAAAGGCPETRTPGFDGVFLSADFAFRKTASEIAAWRCNLADTRSWLWLVEDLTPGSTFTLQLVPDLADSIYLRGRIGPMENVTVPAGTLTALRVDYVVDFGLSSCTDPSGNPMGMARAELRGSVHFAPGIGPIASSEEFVPVAEGDAACSPAGVGGVASRVTMKLVSLPVAVRPATWGSLKSIYR